MADWWTISGWGLTGAFGGLSVFQLWRDLKAAAGWRERAPHLRAIKLGLVQLRAMLTEAEATGEVVKSDPVKQFVRQIGHHTRAIEHHIDAMLEEPIGVPAASLAQGKAPA